jgi:dTDP-4-dehydrorhamnose 3,5-epimerase
VKFTELELAGAYVIDIEPHHDERGFFARTMCAREFAEHGLESAVVQESVSMNLRRGTVRGMHFQLAPHAEVKTVRCTSGSAYDVIVDLRRESPTYGKWHAVELSAENRRTVYIPKGFAHGFQTLEDRTELLYQMSTEFVSAAARGIRWDDATLGIEWPIRTKVTISKKDQELPDLLDAGLK